MLNGGCVGRPWPHASNPHHAAENHPGDLGGVLLLHNVLAGILWLCEVLVAGLVILWILVVIAVDDEHARHVVVQERHVVRAEGLVVMDDEHVLPVVEEIGLRQMVHDGLRPILGLEIDSLLRQCRARPAHFVQNNGCMFYLRLTRLVTSTCPVHDRVPRGECLHEARCGFALDGRALALETKRELLGADQARLLRGKAHKIQGPLGLDPCARKGLCNRQQSCHAASVVLCARCPALERPGVVVRAKRERICACSWDDCHYIGQLHARVLLPLLLACLHAH
mmetsp:Transcript_109967/g.275462  ORF Transcript_109967/g.275462 Transcript_109967/m.275462 type:complete len:281 (+) Transcript_109967:89-931(+)